MADKESQVKEVETTVEEVEKTKAEEATPVEEKAVEANGDAENGSEEKESKDDKEEEKNGHDESDKACAIKRKSTGNDAKEEKPAEDVIPEKKAKIEEAPAEAESNGDAAEDTCFIYKSKMKRPTIKLKSNDGVLFIVDLEIIYTFNTLRHMVELLGTHDLDEEIPIPKLDSHILHKVLEWAFYDRYHRPPVRQNNGVKERQGRKPVTEWEFKFLQYFDSKRVLVLINAADYLDSSHLSYLAALRGAHLIRGKSYAELKESFKR